MTIAIRPARKAGQTFFPAQSMLVKSGETFKEGALVLLDGNGEIIECSADPTVIRGVSAAAAFSGAGREPSNSSLVTTTTPSASGPYVETSIFIPTPNTVFVGQMYSGTMLITPTQAMVGDAFGVAKLGSGYWVIDQEETSADVLTITDIDVDLKLVFFNFHGEHLQSEA